ncbi:MAG: hypothetical protein AAF337_00345 [Pseudomonadota bacterium]
MKPTSSPGTPYASGNVRKSARSYLAQLREERLARRNGASAEEQKTDQAALVKIAKKRRPKVGKRGIRVRAEDAGANTEASIMPDAAETPPAPKKKAKGAKTPDRQAEAGTRMRAGVAKTRAAAQAAQRQMREARAQQREAAARQRQAVRPTRRPAPTPQKSLARPPAPSAPPARSAAPLTQLRGIGDAMCRRLADADIKSLHDLVATPADTLRTRLGPVSALANVEGWQAQAEQLLKG